MQEPFEIADLIFKHLNGCLSEQENDALRKWLDEDIANQILLSEMQDRNKVDEGLHFIESIDTHAAWDKVNTKINPEEEEYSFWSVNRFIKYAAAVILVVFLGYSFYNKSSKPVTPLAKVKTPELLNDALPGGNKATLTLGDGSVMILENIENGTFKNENGLKISKIDGQLVYEILADKDPQVITTNIIATPVGGQYNIILPDGSKVWLNSSSSLHFPTAFSGKERKVKLTGEGYFEISKNPDMPFVVEADGTHVEVLGTHFNLMAYSNEAVSKTTLLEGSVKVGNGSSSEILNPGQQAWVGAQVRVRAVDPQEAIAWKEGYFQFENEDLKTIMRQLKRWYDVDVANEEQIPDKHFTAMISRNTTLSQVLKMLELSGELHFKIEEKRIMISDK